VSFTARNHSCIRKTQWKVPVSPDELANTRKIAITAVEYEGARIQICEEAIGRHCSKSTVEDEGNLCQNTSRNNEWTGLGVKERRDSIMISFTTVDRGDQDGRIENYQSGFQFSASQSS